MLAFLLLALQAPSPIILTNTNPGGPFQVVASSGHSGLGNQIFHQTWGRTFYAPGRPSVLDSFSFWLADYVQGQSAGHSFRAYLMAWDSIAQRPAGPILYQSPTISGVTVPVWPSGGPQVPFTFNVGGLADSPDQLFVAFVTSAGLPQAVTSSSPQVLTPARLLTLPGRMVGIHTVDFTSLTGTTWYTPGADLAFSATFSVSVAPEPKTWVMLGTGLVLIGLLRRRPRRQALGGTHQTHT